MFPGSSFPVSSFPVFASFAGRAYRRAGRCRGGSTARRRQRNPHHSGAGQAALRAGRRAHPIFFAGDRAPVKSTVKRQLTTRAAVESYLKEKFDEDEGAKRLQKGEIVLKKFGLLDRDFQLKPFLLALLDEQIEAYYDSKTKTVNMLDWISIDEQKPVLAHELTHALQDQHSDLEKWNDQTPDEVSTDSSGDTDHVAKDELDTARDAVAEGQATAVMMDYILKPAGKSLLKDPEVMDFAKQQMSTSDSSPVLSRAPLMLSESLLFPYREGLQLRAGRLDGQGTGRGL